MTGKTSKGVHECCVKSCRWNWFRKIDKISIISRVDIDLNKKFLMGKQVI